MTQHLLGSAQPHTRCIWTVHMYCLKARTLSRDVEQGALVNRALRLWGLRTAGYALRKLKPARQLPSSGESDPPTQQDGAVSERWCCCRASSSRFSHAEQASSVQARRVSAQLDAKFRDLLQSKTQVRVHMHKHLLASAASL